MATISITYGDGISSRVHDTFASQYKYQDLISGSPNPESKAEHFERKVREYIKQVVVAGEISDAGNVAIATQKTKSDGEIIIT